VEETIMRLADFTFAFPAMLSAIMLTAVFGRGHRQLHHRHWHLQHPDVCAGHARLGQRRVVARYILARAPAARAAWRITLEHVLPNIASVLIVQATIQFAIAILAEAALSYLGLGTQPPQPSWGRMLSEAQTLMFQAPLLAVWPGVAIALAVLGLNLLGDGLRDLLDPAWPASAESLAPSPSLAAADERSQRPNGGPPTPAFCKSPTCACTCTRTCAAPATAARPMRARRELFTLHRGETLGLMGESGCGKSLTAMALMGLLPEARAGSGSIRFDGQELVGLDDRALCRLRGNRIGMVFQEPMTALNPVHTHWPPGGRAPAAAPRPGPTSRSPRGHGPAGPRGHSPMPRSALMPIRTSSRAGSASASPSPWRWPAGPTC
jgi:hypothetical protein